MQEHITHTRYPIAFDYTLDGLALSVLLVATAISGWPPIWSALLLIGPCLWAGYEIRRMHALQAIERIDTHKSPVWRLHWKDQTFTDTQMCSHPRASTISLSGILETIDDDQHIRLCLTPADMRRSDYKELHNQLRYIKSATLD